jgi:hypothetical protein
LLGEAAPRGTLSRSLIGMREVNAAEATRSAPVLSQRRSYEQPPRPELAHLARSLIEEQWQLVRCGECAPRLYDLDRDPLGLADTSLRNEAELRRLEARLGKLAPLFAPRYENKGAPLDLEHERALRELGYTR